MDRPKTDRVPHFFSAPDGEILGFAGLWESWRNPEAGEEVTSCTIITRDAGKWMSAYHDRMPAMVKQEDFQA